MHAYTHTHAHTHKHTHNTQTYTHTHTHINVLTSMVHIADTTSEISVSSRKQLGYME